MPVSKTITFDPAGGTLFARATAGQGALGSYGFLLFEPGGLVEVPMPAPSEGHFGEPPNTHRLPGAAAENDGRRLAMSSSVGLMDETRAFAVHLTMLQDGRELGTADDVGVEPGDGDTHDDQFFIDLEARTVVAKKAAGVAKKKGVSRAKKSAARPKKATSRTKKATRAKKATSRTKKATRAKKSPSRPKKGGRR